MATVFGIGPGGGGGTALPATLPTSGPYRDLFTAFVPELSETQKQQGWDEFLLYWSYGANPANNDNLAIDRLIELLRSQRASTSYPLKGIYKDLMDYFLGFEKSEAELQAVWRDFLQGQGLSANPADNDATAIDNFASFLRSVAPNTAYPTTNVFADLISAFIGDARSDLDLQRIWRAFLKTYGYSINPQPGDLQAVANFTKFIQQIIESERRETLSPLEIEKRRILLEVYDVLLNALITMQRTISVRSKALIFLGTLQQEYTRMLTKVPVYTATGPATWNVSATNADDWALGFDHTSVADVSDFIAVKLKSGINESFTLTNKAGDINPYIQITFTTGDPTDLTTTPPKIEFKLVGTSGETLGDPFTYIFTDGEFDHTDASTATIAPLPASDPRLTIDEISRAFQEKFLDLYNSPATHSGYTGITPSGDATLKEVIDNNVALNGFGPYIATPYAGTTEDAAQLRGEINIRNQVVSENIRAYRGIAKSSAERLQANLTADKDALTQMSNLLTSIIELFKDIGASITNK